MNSILFYGVLPTPDKIKNREEIFADFEKQYYLTNYIPDFKSQTLYIFSEEDKEFIQSKINNVRFFDYFELVEMYQQLLPTAYDYLISTCPFDMMLKMHTVQISLNEILFWFHHLESDYDTYSFVSNSFDIRAEHKHLFDETNWYFGFDIYASGILSMDRAFAKRFQCMIVEETELFYTNNTYYDNDSERLKYHLIKKLGLTTNNFCDISKTKTPGFDKQRFLYHTIHDCSDKLQEHFKEVR